jgi:asparagine synthase (glutamine-hydrolysing)
MCGIAGFLSLQGDSPREAAHLYRMLGQLRHRGPDEFGTYLDRRVGLGNTRLSIVDLAGGQQPLSNETSTLWIVYNGEIFNHPELRRDLEAKGHRFATHSDTEVIVHLYEEYGRDGLSRLNGQFAFALWDATKRALVLARDRFGECPLYYTQVGGALLFASEIKSLFADPAVPRVLDLRGVAQVFNYWSTLAPATCFEGVNELLPGHCLVADDRGVTVTPYWQLRFVPPDSSLARSVSRRNFASLAEEYAERLIDATRIRLRADVPVGAYLSGGLDSSTIAAIVRHLGHGKLDTFSVAFEDATFDESASQQRMAALLGTDHQVIRISPADITRHLPDVLWHTETPLTRTAPVPMFLLSKLVRSRQYKVVLTGEGADEFAGGYDIFKEAKIRRFWAREPGSLRRPTLFGRLYPEIGRLGSAAPAFVKAFFGAELDDTSAVDYSHRLRWRNNRRTQRFFSHQFAGQLARLTEASTPDFTPPEDFMRWDHLQQAQYIEATTFLPGYLLSSQGDRVAMGNSVEGRHPFLDPDLVEFCQALPESAKLPALREKALLREAAKRWLPAEIATRRKRPYRAPIQRCFKADQTPDYVPEIFSEKSLEKSGLFSPKAAHRLYQAVQKDRELGETDEMALVGILSLEMIRRQFITDFSPQPALNPAASVRTINART